MVELRKKLQNALSDIQQNPITDAIAKAGLKAIPIAGDFFLDLYENSKGPIEDKNQKIIQILENFQQMSDVRQEEELNELRRLNGVVLANQGYLNDLVEKTDKIIDSINKVGTDVKINGQKIDDVKTMIKKQNEKLDAVLNSPEYTKKQQLEAVYKILVDIRSVYSNFRLFIKDNPVKQEEEFIKWKEKFVEWQNQVISLRKKLKELREKHAVQEDKRLFEGLGHKLGRELIAYGDEKPEKFWQNFNEFKNHIDDATIRTEETIEYMDLEIFRRN